MSLEQEVETLKNIVIDLQWMARRYANGRMSYAVGMLNDHTEVLLNLGLNLNPCAEKQIFARDGMGEDIPAFKLPDHLEQREKEYLEEYYAKK